MTDKDPIDTINGYSQAIGSVTNDELSIPDEKLKKNSKYISCVHDKPYLLFVSEFVKNYDE